MDYNKKPRLNSKKFICPICNCFSLFTWYTNNICINDYDNAYLINLGVTMNNTVKDKVSICTCHSCSTYILWINDEIIYPLVSLAPSPNKEMPKNVKEIYEEARKVYPYSKKSSSALLRLALQLLCKELGKDGKNINEDIKSLVQDGLSPMIQKSLDIIRVTGNEAVHPGVIDFTDEENDIAFSLFNIMNIIVEKMIVEPKEIEEIYNQLPEDKREYIENRDKQINN